MDGMDGVNWNGESQRICQTRVRDKGMRKWKLMWMLR